MSVKMQILSGVFLLVLLLNSQRNCGVQADDKNLTRLLNNQVIVTKQIMCVLEKSPCDQLGRQLKGTLRCTITSQQHAYITHITTTDFIHIQFRVAIFEIEACFLAAIGFELRGNRARAQFSERSDILN